MPASRRPSIDYYDLDGDVLSIVLNEYGIVDDVSILPILVDGESGSLLDVRSETSRKVVLEVRGVRFFLKQIPWYCDDEARLNWSCHLQTALCQCGLPVPRIIQNRSGNSWVEIRNKKFVLFEYCEGRRYGGTPSDRAAAGRMLAQMHRVSFTPAQTSWAEDVFELAIAHIDLLEQCLVPRNGTPDAEFADAHHHFRTYALGAFRSRVRTAREACVRAGWDSLATICAHGDYSPWNVLYDITGEVAGVLDFDNSGPGKRLHDVCEGAVTFGTLAYRQDTTNFSGEVPAASWSPAATEFLDAYESISPLTTIERDCLAWVTQVVLIELMCLGMVRADFRLDDFPAMLECLDADVLIQ